MAYTLKITPKMKQQFVSETTAHLNNLEKMLILLEKSPEDVEAINAAFRAVHGIKGNSDYLGYKDLNTLSHAMEDLLDDLRSGRKILDRKLLSALLAGHDLLRAQVGKVTDEKYEMADVSDILSLLQRSIKTAATRAESTPERGSRKIDKRAVFIKAAVQHIDFIKEVCSALTEGKKVQGAQKNLLRSLSTFHVSARYSGFTSIAAALLEMKNSIADLSSVRKKAAHKLLAEITAVEEMLSDDTAATAGVRSKKKLPEADYTDAIGHGIRVSPEKLENIVNIVSQLVIFRNGLNHLLLDKRGTDGKEDPWLKELKTMVAAMDRSIGQLQHRAMDMRLMKISILFERLPRLIRDLGVRSGKKVRLTLIGEDFEVDRKVVDHLFEPMLHLIRNAVDHGIELPEERIQRGKADEGVITVKSYQEGSFAIIDVIDDGQGLDIERIKQGVIEKGLVTAEALHGMTTEEIITCIFMPGYTTTARATQVSGRGVGLDVVKNNIQSIGGSVLLTHKPGQGSRFSMRVPLTMAMEEVLLVESAGELYAFPFAAVQENMTVSRQLIEVMHAREVIPYRDTVISLRHLDCVMGTTAPKKLRKAELAELAVIVLAFGGRYQGIVVDQVLRRESVLIKPLDKHLGKIRELRGAALMGDGSIVFIIDPIGLFT